MMFSCEETCFVLNFVLNVLYLCVPRTVASGLFCYDNITE